MEFLRSSRRRTLLSETIYVLLNLAVVGIIFSVVYFVGSPLLAFGIVLLSKWRVFAVRPQYWGANIVANLIDVIVGLSFVVFLASAGGNLVLQLILVVLYALWLLFLKPRSKRRYVISQAGVGLILGVAALLQISYDWWSSAVVIGMWVIGYAAARHMLGAYKEPHTQILSLAFAIVTAQLGWLAYHWTFAYTIVEGFQIAQMALIIAFLGFLVERAYASYHRHERIEFSDMVLPLLLSISSIVLLLTLFGGVQTI